MNAQHPSISFEIEHPRDNSQLSLLDLNVTISPNDTPHFKYYQKEAKKGVFLHYKSALPSVHKKNIIYNERQRRLSRCTSTEDKIDNQHKFDALLRQNGYPHHFIDETYTLPHRRINDRNTEWFYMKVPFISERINRGLLSIFKAEKMPIRFYHTNVSLRNFLKKENVPLNRCTCPFNNVCSKKNVVYEIQCRICHKYYIGSTIRRLHERIQEHLRNTNSSIYRHSLTCTNANLLSTANRWKIRTLSRDSDGINLRIKEAILIKQRNPLLNSREELNDLLISI
jgi:hypothetical protein